MHAINPKYDVAPGIYPRLICSMALSICVGLVTFYGLLGLISEAFRTGVMDAANILDTKAGQFPYFRFLETTAPFRTKAVVVAVIVGLVMYVYLALRAFHTRQLSKETPLPFWYRAWTSSAESYFGACLKEMQDELRLHGYELRDDDSPKVEEKVILSIARATVRHDFGKMNPEQIEKAVQHDMQTGYTQSATSPFLCALGPYIRLAVPSKPLAKQRHIDAN